MGDERPVIATGMVLTQRGRGGRTFDYRLVDSEPYTRRSGAASFLLIWEGTCAICGEDFITKSGRRPRSLIRTCIKDRNTPREYWPTAEGQPHA